MKTSKKNFSMQLNEFVKQVIISVVAGVNESQNLLKDTSAIVNPSTIKDDYIDGMSRKVINVNFDVGVTITEEGANSKGIKIAVFDVLSGKADRETKTANQTVSRVSFSVPVALPVFDNLLEEAQKKQTESLRTITL